MDTNNQFAWRSSAATKIAALLMEKPGHWVHWRRFEKIAPCSWRTRISDVRKQLSEGTIEWNHSNKRSAYRYLPYKPLGRDASEQVSQKSLF